MPLPIAWRFCCSRYAMTLLQTNEASQIFSLFSKTSDNYFSKLGDELGESQEVRAALTPLLNFLMTSILFIYYSFARLE